jgi:aryl-alcohol dehydrogenase-like predicted oxidoreductase
MRTRPFGTTGTQVSELGFGCASFWGRAMFPEAQAIALVHQALDLGITFFDTGASYGGGVAETRLGLALRGRDTSGLLIATKAGPEKVDGKVVRDYSPDAIEASLKRSRERLGLDTIPLFQLHGPEITDMTDALFERLWQLRARGWYRWLGLNSFDHEPLDWAIASGRFDSVMLDYNVLRANRATLIGTAAERGMATIAGMPLAMGHIDRQAFKLRRMSDLWYLARGIAYPRHRADLLAGLRYGFLRQIEGWSAAQAALGWVLANQQVSVAVVGTTRPEHLTELATVPGRALPESVMARIAETQHRH